VAEVDVSSLVTEVLPPDDIGLLWDKSFNGVGDDVVAVVPVDVMVYDMELDAPLQGVEVTLAPHEPDVRVVGPDALELIDPADCYDCVGALDTYRGFYVTTLEGFDGDVLITDVDGIARAYVEVDAFPLTDAGLETIGVDVEADGHVVDFLIVPE
jgi:hypothetical protein